MNQGTEVAFNNHASLLIKHNGKFLLTDPWFQTPAFGSWLPTYPPAFHPTYLASLKENLAILVSHGHDDHLDDKLLDLFDKNTPIVTANFKSPSVKNRLKKIGFTNIIEVDDKGSSVPGGFFIKSYIDTDISHDDAVYTIATDDGFIIHANDNWHAFSDEKLASMSSDVSKYSPESVLLFSQTNSASGFPLNYTVFTEEEKQAILKSKVMQMVRGGLENARQLGLERFFSYAGYASVYVKSKPYKSQSLFPTGRFLNPLLAPETLPSSSSPKVEDFYPGDYISLPSGIITRAFISGSDYTDTALVEKSDAFYTAYGVVNNCTSYSVPESVFDKDQAIWFLEKFNEFVSYRVETLDQSLKSIIGKTFSLVITDENSQSEFFIEFGKGLITSEKNPTKRCIVDSVTFQHVLSGHALFEDLYTGYGAEWSRFPKDKYNRDIVLMIVMFSYVYKNRLRQQYEPLSA